MNQAGYPTGFDYEKVYSISEFTGILKNFVEYNFYAVRLKGEVSSLKTNYSSGYYFDLKDEGSKISCILFKRDISRVRFEIKDGLFVIVHGRMNIYEARGNYSVIINDIEPFGYGDLHIMFERLKEKLEAEGLFDEKRKRKIPFLPNTIGIVTSKSGAVLHDILKIIYSRFENTRIVFANTSVQGEKAPVEIKNAIELLNSYNRAQTDDFQKIKVIIVGRGGGSIEDLWAFNDEITARAIYNSEIPIISAVGHEPDITIADFVADIRASTPSNAAEIVIPVKTELTARITVLRERLNLSRAVELKKKQLLHLTHRIFISSPKKIIDDRRLKIDDLLYKLNQNLKNRFDSSKNKIEFLKKRLSIKDPSNIIKLKKQVLESLLKSIENTVNNLLKLKYRKRIDADISLLNSYNPYNVLKRGYSIVYREENKIATSVSGIYKGDKIRVKLSDGEISGIVDGIKPIKQ